MPLFSIALSHLCRRSRKFTSILILIVSSSVLPLGFLICPTFVGAQSTGGRILGRVADPSGAVLSGVKITATNEATGVVYSGKSNANGEYRISNLPEGTYDLRTVLTGFSPST